ncbi:MAG: phosphoribosylformylglycinamidine synthase subunit PurS [Endomicrobium sp.]|jgi:phosphoribosylformylglycinamidine synthase|nr:phosphoribosylformylglycinamidine synthase subunit PurS [Endomicrobium sp.]
MFEIEILTKKDFKDSRGERVLSDICGLGVTNVTKAEYSQLYVVDGDINLSETEMIASELLVDKVTESYIIRKCCAEYCSEVILKSSDAKENDRLNSNFSVIEVWYKKGVTDTVSESVVKAVEDLGIVKEIKVKTGYKYYLYGKISRTILLNTIATKLLANTLIQECKVHCLADKKA